MKVEIRNTTIGKLIHDITTPTVKRYYRQVTYNGGNELVRGNKHYFVDQNNVPRCSLCYKFVKHKQLFCKCCWRRVMREEENR